MKHYGKKICIILFCVCILPLIGCGSTKEKEYLGYSTLTDKNHVFQETTISNAIESILYTESSFYLYLGYSTCPWCKEYIPYMNQAAKEEGVTRIYYINIKPYRDYTVDYENHELIGLEDEYMTLAHYIGMAASSKTFTDPNNTENSFTIDSWIYVPRIMYVNNGLVMDYYGSVPGHTKEEDGVLPALNDTQKDTLLTKYHTLFQLYKNNAQSE